jgi:hypothetical protein
VILALRTALLAVSRRRFDDDYDNDNDNDKDNDTLAAVQRK